MDFLQNFRILNPILKLHWAGWEATTPTLQRAGWEISVEQDIQYRTIQFVLRHSVYKIYALTDRIDLDYMEVARIPFNTVLENMVINVIYMSSKLEVRAHMNPLRFSPLNAEPEYNTCFEFKDIEDFKIFAPIQIPQHKIIIDPNNAELMLSRILELQDPKQKEIRYKRRKEITKFLRENTDNVGSLKVKDNLFAEIVT